MHARYSEFGFKSKVAAYLSCSAAGDADMISEASFKALLKFCSPSAAIT